MSIRRYLPKRFSEIVTLVSVSTTLFLYIQTRDLAHRLHEIKRPYDEYPVTLYDDKNSAPEKSSQNNQVQAKPRQLYSWEISKEPLDPLKLNNTRKAQKEILFFNRVPKVGSQTTMELMRALALKNNFHYHKDRTQKVETIKLTNNEEKWLSHLINYFSTPSVYVKHVCFVDFQRFNISMPIYVNMVRDPIERVISWYYYVRAPWYFVERKRAFPDLPLPNPNWLRKDYELCVKRGDNECKYLEGGERDDFGQLTEFFCGQEDDCT